MSSSDTISTEQSFLCIKCEREFEFQKDLKEHFSDQHQCQYCEKTFSSKFHVKNHEMTHTGERPFVCGTCGRSFIQMSNLKSHKKTHTTHVSHFCEECGKEFIFIREKYGEEHKKFHTGERPFCCEQCGRTFYYKGDLNKHKKSHSEEKPPVCNKCGKVFKCEISFKSHMLSCVTERPGKPEEGLCSSDDSSATHEDKPSTSQN